MDGRAKILVTRPEPGASRTAEKLQASGLVPLLCPFTEMIAKPFHASGIPSHIDAIVITSANAIRFLKSSLIKTLIDIPVFAVGDATAEAALQGGFSQVSSADGDASALCAMIAAQKTQPQNLLYFCGVTRTDHVEKVLHNADHTITLIETYETKKVSQLTYKLTKMLETHHPDSIALYSGISAQLFADIYDTLSSSQAIEIKTLFCISERAKNCLPVSLHARALVCPAPRDDEMVRFIRQYYGL